MIFALIIVAVIGSEMRIDFGFGFNFQNVLDLVSIIGI